MPAILRFLFNHKQTQLYLLITATFIIISNHIVYTNPEDFCPNYYAAKYFIDNISIYSRVPCGFLDHNAQPPFATLIYLPFALLPLFTATIVWGFSSSLCYLAAGLLMLRTMKWLSIRSFMIFTVCSIFWSYLFIASFIHNIGQLFLLLIVVSYFLRKSNHFYLSGILLGLLSLIKIWPVILVLGSFAVGQRKVGIVGLATILIGLVGTLFLFTSDTYRIYVNDIYVYEQEWLNFPDNISVVGTVLKFYTGSSAFAIGLGLSAAIAVFTFCFIYLQSKRVGMKNEELLVEGVLLTNTLLIFPMMWGWSAILLFLPGVILLKNLNKYPKQPYWWYGLFIFGFIAIFNPFAALGFVSGSHSSLTLDIRVFMNLLLTVGIVCFSLVQVFFIVRTEKALPSDKSG